MGIHIVLHSQNVYSFNRTFAQDPSMDPSYAGFLKTKCPRQVNTRSSPDPLVPFDPVTPNWLDNNYYLKLEEQQGTTGFRSSALE